MADPGYYFFPGDYRRDTAHLTLIEDGAYRRLLDHYYSTGTGLPVNIDTLSRIAGAMTADEREAVVRVADQFFPTANDGLRRNKRADAEIQKRREYIEAQRSRSALGVTARSTKRSTDGSTKRSTKGSTLPYPSPLPVPKPKPQPKKAFAKNVSMTDEEHDGLVAKHGSAAVEWMIERLDAAKDAKGYVYKSDAGAIRSWVVKEWEAHKASRSGGSATATAKVRAWTTCTKCGQAGNATRVGICDSCFDKEEKI